MNGHFGIDFASEDMGLVDQAIRAFGPVAFVGQYLPVYPTNRARVDLIHARGAAVLPIWNEDQRGERCGGSYAMGYADGVEAAIAWRALGLPAGCAIFPDFENSFAVSGEYLHGILDGIAAQRYVGGAYLNPISGINHAAAWQYARSRGAHGVVFTCQHEPLGLANVPLREFVVGGFPSRAPVPGYEDDTVVGQYCIPPQSNVVPVDLDVCSDRGLALMWGAMPPKPAAPPPYHVADRCALKQDHTHASGVAIDPARKEVYLEAGADVVPTGRTFTDAAGEVWWEVRLTRGEAVVHGWLPRTLIAEGL